MFTDFPFFRSTLLLVFSMVFPFTPATAADRCSRWAPMAPGEVVRDARGTSDPECYVVDLGRPGALLLEVSTNAEANVAVPRLEVFECDDGAPSSLRVRDRWASSWLGELTWASRVAVCVSSQDPAGRLPEFKLVSAFAERPWTKGGDPDEDEPEPDGEPAGQGLCQLAATDDHSDLFRCATPLEHGKALEAEIHNPWGDDEDVFALRLDELTTVGVRVVSEGELAVTLHDGFGQRLQTSEVTEAEGLRFYKTLARGVYFLRVSSPLGVEGTYSLQVEAR